jgi:hypothetical protein
MKKLKVTPVFLASDVYYKEEDFEKDSSVLFSALKKDDSGDNIADPVKIFSSRGFEEFLEGTGTSCPLIIPMSGAIQQQVLQIARTAEYPLLFRFQPNDRIFDEETNRSVDRIVSKNALPAIADTWGRLNNEGLPVTCVRDSETLGREISSISKALFVKQSRLLVIGYTQQWVVSASQDPHRIEKVFGTGVSHIGLEELFAAYKDIKEDPDALSFAESFMLDSMNCVEPNKEQVIEAYRVYLAIKGLMEKYGCNCLTISCFSLAKTLGVTACLALSMINDTPGMVAACEGDMDSAISMLVGKAVTGRPVFMGNPVFNLNNTLDLVHCTAPRKLLGEEVQPYEIRSHHETGLSVAQRVEVKTGTRATIFRIGNEYREATVYEAELMDTPREDTCRTQFRFSIDSSEKRFSQILGCHQMVVFGSWEEEISEFLSRFFDISTRD